LHKQIIMQLAALASRRWRGPAAADRDRRGLGCGGWVRRRSCAELVAELAEPFVVALEVIESCKDYQRTGRPPGPTSRKHQAPPSV